MVLVAIITMRSFCSRGWPLQIQIQQVALCRRIRWPWIGSTVWHHCALMCNPKANRLIYNLNATWSFWKIGLVCALCSLNEHFEPKTQSSRIDASCSKCIPENEMLQSEMLRAYDFQESGLTAQSSRARCKLGKGGASDNTRSPYKHGERACFWFRSVLRFWHFE